jgi:outer membrane protein OmpA-like peptidoglycan-associated protein
MRVLCLLLACLSLAGCELWFGGGRQREPADDSARAQKVEAPARPKAKAKPEIPLHPELARSQALLAEAAALPTAGNQFMGELEQARARLDQAVAIWKAEKGKLDEDDEEWHEVHHLNYLARQRTAIVVMKARGLDAQHQLAALQSPGARSAAQPRRPKPITTRPAVATDLPPLLQELRPRQEPRGLVLTLDERHFAPGQASLMNGEALLDALLEYLVGHPAKNVACEGHSGSEESDASGQYLSQQRARAVQQALLEGGLEFSRITAVGYGGTHPLVSDGVVLGRSARVEIVISDS